MQGKDENTPNISMQEKEEDKPFWEIAWEAAAPSPLKAINEKINDMFSGQPQDVPVFCVWRTLHVWGSSGQPQIKQHNEQDETKASSPEVVGEMTRTANANLTAPDRYDREDVDRQIQGAERSWMSCFNFFGYQEWRKISEKECAESARLNKRFL